MRWFSIIKTLPHIPKKIISPYYIASAQGEQVRVRQSKPIMNEYKEKHDEELKLMSNQVNERRRQRHLMFKNKTPPLIKGKIRNDSPRYLVDEYDA